MILAQIFLVAVGIATSFSFASIGIIYYGEILMAVVAPWCLLHKCRTRGFLNRSVLVLYSCLTITTAAYVVADLVNQTDSNNAIRGMGRLFFIFTDTMFLYGFCFDRPQNLRLFCLGTVVGDLLVGFFYDHSGYPWKSAYGVPLTLLVVLILSAKYQKINGTVGAMLLLGLSAIHMVLDFRSFSALCLLLALMFAHSYSKRFGRSSLSVLQIATVSLVGLALVYVLYRDSDVLYHGRRQDSNAYRKSGIVTALAAISSAPLLGSGSWSHESEFQMLFQQSLADEGTRLTAPYEAHSQLLQSWYEGGLLATVFLLYLGFELGRSSLYIFRRRPPDDLTLLYSFFLFLASWDLLMSPFAGWLRLRISIVATIVLLLHREHARQKQRLARRPESVFAMRVGALG